MMARAGISGGVMGRAGGSRSSQTSMEALLCTSYWPTPRRPCCPPSTHLANHYHRLSKKCSAAEKRRGRWGWLGGADAHVAFSCLQHHG